MLSRIKKFFDTRKPLIIICGPTASGKTGLSLDIATGLKESGAVVEVVSADSRQIYQSLPIFSGAIPPRDMREVPHHLVGTEPLSVVPSVEWFKDKASSIIQAITGRGHIPVVVGGSAFWVQSLLLDTRYPEVPPNPSLRAELEEYSLKELYQRLQVLDIRRAGTIDPQNPRRLIRAIEIATYLGSVPDVEIREQSQYRTLVIYVDLPKEENNEKIAHNVHTRMNDGLLDEADAVATQVSEERMVELGLAYKHLSALRSGELSLDEYTNKVIQEEQQYAKRQRTFFKKMLDEYKGERIVTTNVDVQSTQEILIRIKSLI